ncbi:alpha/beta hydrolase [Nocardioides sp. Soil805]|uniref:alpha/beta hydrolase n=1 Tax=Nocardioides sp. Soil805 TaxID=1736416 RepID=UPI0007038F77|nr:alpha/beta fold hydrolase [Nocardioides sp. Soil805]KRF35342.1 hypothetical protein ASG94_14685 [Nocardioides sp. Soil805]
MATTRARLVATHVPREPEGVVLVLHGGASRTEQAMVSPTQLSVLRMVPVAARIARAGGRRLAVYRLLNSHRGWDSSTTPVMDVAWALDEVARSLGPLPTALVGHSLGGRAALLAADRPGVRSAVALNPWLYPSDGVDLSGRQVLFVHGTDDRVASPERAAAVARRLSATARVGFVAVPGGRHAMLRHGRTFERYAAEFVGATLLGTEPTSAAVTAVLAGEAFTEA